MLFFCEAFLPKKKGEKKRDLYALVKIKVQKTNFLFFLTFFVLYF